MARPQRNELAVQEFALKLSKIRKAQNDSSKAKDIELWLFANHEARISEESIRKALAGQIDPSACDIALLVGLASYYGVKPSDLGVAAEKRINAVMSMAGHSGGPEGGPTQGTPSNAWMYLLPGDDLDGTVVPLVRSIRSALPLAS